jgi:uncharacterized membrane-anchored protein YhcB (DUF1043 family)
MEGTQWFKLVTDNLVSVVVAYMLLKFFIEIMRHKLLGDSEIEKQNLEKNTEILSSLTNLNTKADHNQRNVENCFGKTTSVLDKISNNQTKLCTLIESVDRRINGKNK